MWVYRGLYIVFFRAAWERAQQLENHTDELAESHFAFCVVIIHRFRGTSLENGRGNMRLNEYISGMRRVFQ